MGDLLTPDACVPLHRCSTPLCWTFSSQGNEGHMQTPVTPLSLRLRIHSSLIGTNLKLLCIMERRVTVVERKGPETNADSNNTQTPSGACFINPLSPIAIRPCLMKKA
ncbi:hypothetical protein H920_15438 [Fukomys damarensis]|uniref:Uncharacterized protein n=1 Tax=Fukomys damarensis TaxID=885580 RepID=A0A091CYF9_FUKDA|nr:hypothetical protein H920_15438 [Fukomys damarensis]